MANGYIIGFAQDDNMPMSFYWNGTVQVPINSSTNPQDATLYPDKISARLACAQLQQRFSNQCVQEIAAQRNVVLDIANSPAILAPAAPAPPSYAPASAPPPGS